PDWTSVKPQSVPLSRLNPSDVMVAGAPALQLLGEPLDVFPATIVPSKVTAAPSATPTPPIPRSVAVLKAIVLFSIVIVLRASFQLNTPPPSRAVFPLIVLFLIVSAPWWACLSPKF